jgi:hypothetical protein
MFEPNNSIIIVDDREDDLLELAKVFNSIGISCRTIQYNSEYNNPLKGVRIAFFDINISGKNYDFNQQEFNYTTDASLSSVFNDLAIAIGSCIDKESAPFALIFWSKNTGVIDNFKVYVRERVPKLPSPILIDSIDKSYFIGNPDGVKERIEQIFANSSIKLLLDFENSCVSAASDIINDIYKIIPKNPQEVDKVWASNVEFEENFEKIFSKIAFSTLGLKYAKDNTDRAVSEALLPILNHNILKKSGTETKWKKHLQTLQSSKPFFPKDFKEGILNSIFHIEYSNGDKEVRGTVIKLNKLDGNLISTLKIDDLDKWFNSFIPFIKNNDLNKKKKQIRANSELIAVELSAACDFSQSKPRINKYLIGFITPIIEVKTDIDEERRPDNSYHIGGSNFFFNEKEFQIWLNLNFVFGAKPDDPRLGDAMFILKKEIMDMIGNKYASHISRIGITSF